MLESIIAIMHLYPVFISCSPPVRETEALISLAIDYSFVKVRNISVIEKKGMQINHKIQYQLPSVKAPQGELFFLVVYSCGIHIIKNTVQ